MPNHNIAAHLTNWTEEINASLLENSSTCIALFSSDKKLIFANTAMTSLFSDKPSKSILSPTIDKLLELQSTSSVIYKGFLTIGNDLSVNTSIMAQVYRKNDILFIIGGVNTQQLIEHNKTMHQLNGEINNLQRQLIKEKHTLENTLVQLHEANKELKELNATKDKLFSIIAHDLKGPINNILGFSNLLVTNAKDYDISKIDGFLKIINSESQAILKLLENLLNWAKSQTGQISFDPEKILLSSIIQEIIEFLKPTATVKNISLNYRNKNLEVYADRNMLKTILRNLISNSIKFTKPEGEINIYTISTQNYIEVTVSDNGVGMNKQTQNKLFGVDKSFTTKGTSEEKGTGLGLILCKEFTERQGGKIWVESELGKGSDFKFIIPIMNIKR